MLIHNDCTRRVYVVILCPAARRRLVASTIRKVGSPECYSAVPVVRPKLP